MSEERAAAQIVTEPSNEGQSHWTEEHIPAAAASARDVSRPETWTDAERLARQREVDDMLREIRRGKTVAPAGREQVDDRTAHASFRRRDSDDWLRNT